MDNRSSLQLPAESPGTIELGPCTATSYPLHYDTGLGSGINDDVIPKVDRGTRGYIYPSCPTRESDAIAKQLQLIKLCSLPARTDGRNAKKYCLLKDYYVQFQARVLRVLAVSLACSY